MSVETVRALSSAYLNRTRLRYVAGFVLAAVVAAQFAWFAWTATDPIIRLGNILVVASTGWMVWRIARRFPRGAPDSTAASSLVDHYRDELLRQKVRYVDLLVSAGPTLAGCVVIMVGRQLQPVHANPLPVAAFTALWLAGAWLVVRRHSRRVDQKLAELDRMQGE